MVGSLAIVGFGNSTNAYRLTAQNPTAPSASARLANDVTLSSASTTVSNGTTTVRFTISVSVVELFVGAALSAPIHMIFATGVSPELSYHGSSRANQLIDLSCLPPPSPPPPSSTAAPCTAFQCSLPLDGPQLRMYWTLNTDVLDITLDAHTSGYVALGFSSNGWMQGSLAVLGWGGAGASVRVYQLYQLATDLPSLSAIPSTSLPLLSSTASESAGRTQVSFSVRASDIPSHLGVNTRGGSSQLIWAWSDVDTLVYHGQSRGTGWINWASGEGHSSRADTRRDEQRRHGLIMYFAFAVFMPAAILVGRYGRMLLPATLCVAVFVALVGFSYALYQFPRLNARHGNLGWTVIALMLTQLGGASYRPAKPEHGGPESSTKDIEKSTRRRAWEWFHRTFGLTTLFLGLINIYVGLGRYKDEQQEDVWQLMLGFSVYIGVVAVAAVVLELVTYRMRVKKDAARVQSLRGFGVEVGMMPTPGPPL
eukprot:jgi/Mesvir1/20515/Mv12396-RA.1